MPTDRPAPGDARQALLKRLETAHGVVVKLAQTYGKSFRMSIPSREDDTDLFLCTVIREAIVALQPDAAPDKGGDAHDADEGRSRSDTTGAPSRPSGGAAHVCHESPSLIHEPDPFGGYPAVCRFCRRVIVVEDTDGQPLLDLDHVIATARRSALEEAIAAVKATMKPEPYPSSLAGVFNMGVAKARAALEALRDRTPEPAGGQDG